SWSSYILRLVSQKQRMQTIDRLCDVCHLNLGGIPVENVKGDGCMQCIAQRSCLTQDVAGCDQSTRRVPGSPFVDHQLRSMLWIQLPHGVPVLFDHSLSTQPFSKNGIPFLRRGLFWNDLGIAEVCVEVQCKAIRRFAVHGFKESCGPADVPVTRMSARAGGHQKRLGCESRELRDEFSIQRGVLARFHVAATAPRLVANAPIANSERILLAVRSPLISQTQRSQRSIAVGDPVV